MITDKYIHALSLQALVAPKKYEADTCEWEKLLAHEKKWADWKKKFCNLYAAKQRGDKARDSVDQPFEGAVAPITREDSILAGLNEMMDPLAG